MPKAKAGAQGEHEDDFYAILQVDRDADRDTIRKAYLRLALALHPDKNSGDEQAKQRFQKLQEVYRVLSSPELRKAYDDFGPSAVDASESDFDGLAAFFRTAFRQVNEAEIESFAQTYRGSDEERGDLLRLFEEKGGDMGEVFDFLMLSRPDVDSHRFADAIDEAIGQGKVKSYAPYKRWRQKVAKTPRPKKDPLAAPESRGEGPSKGGALVHAIQQRRGERERAFDMLLAKVTTRRSSRLMLHWPRCRATSGAPQALRSTRVGANQRGANAVGGKGSRRRRSSRRRGGRWRRGARTARWGRSRSHASLRGGSKLNSAAPLRLSPAWPLARKSASMPP